MASSRTVAVVLAAGRRSDRENAGDGDVSGVEACSRVGRHADRLTRATAVGQEISAADRGVRCSQQISTKRGDFETLNRVDAVPSRLAIDHLALAVTGAPVEALHAISGGA